jgi:hypothetical protein
MRILIIIIFSLLVTHISASESDEALFNKILGVWSTEVDSDDLKTEGIKEYRSDGTIITSGKVYIDGEVVEEFLVKSKWHVLDGYSHMEILKSSHTHVLPIGHKFSEKIISVDDKQFIYEKKNGTQYTLKRIK